MTPQSGFDAATATALVSELANDLAQAFEDVVRAYQGQLYGFAFGLCGDRRDAEEIAQDAFVRAYRALQGYPPERTRALALRPWLYQITLNVARNRKRRHVPPLTPLGIGDGEQSRDGRHPPPVLAMAERLGPEASSERGATRATLAALVANLPVRFRAAVILRHVEGLPYTEVARVLGQPLGTVKSNVHRGTLLLRAAWRAHCAEEGVTR